MSIRINSGKCTGCGKCSIVCPGSLLYKDASGKTVNRFPKDCWGCTACIKECRFGAILYFLGADMGGRGTTVSTKKEGDLLHWIFIKPSGEERIITINGKEANKY
jgi:adenylylsulfate reductase, subunit B